MFKIKRYVLLCICISSCSFLLYSCNNMKNTSSTTSKIVASENIQDQKTLLWESKIRFLSETDAKPFDNPENLKKDYILKICQYYQALSDCGLEYDNANEKYIIANSAIQNIVYSILGIKDFEYSDSQYFNSKNGLYEFKEYPSFNFINREYGEISLENIDDDRQKFIIEITDKNKSNQKYTETYILKKDNDNNYFVASMDRD